MSLLALVFSADDKVVRVLRRVLSELEIGMEVCADAESAIHQLTRRRFEAVIVDCTDQRTASRVLRSAHSAPVQQARRGCRHSQRPDRGGSASTWAHTLSYISRFLPNVRKPAFGRFARLMKRERRRNARIAVETPVIDQVNDGAGQLRAVTTDLGEGGMAIQLAHRPKKLGPVTIQFSLPGSTAAEDVIECKGQVAWENPGRQVGLRFVDLASRNPRPPERMAGKPCPGI